MRDIIDNIHSFLKKIKDENPEINNLDIRHHPGA